MPNFHSDACAWTDLVGGRSTGLWLGSLRTVLKTAVDVNLMILSHRVAGYSQGLRL